MSNTSDKSKEPTETLKKGNPPTKHDQREMMIRLTLLLLVLIACGVWHVRHRSAVTPNAGQMTAEESLQNCVEQWTDASYVGQKAGDLATVTLPGGIPMRFRWCPAGTFTMGSPETEEKRNPDETQHHVTLTRGFWMGETEVTQAQWASVMGKNPSCFTGADCPVERVSWEECQQFIGKINWRLFCAMRLPTEAEWEYACRAGSPDAYGGSGVASKMGWFNANSGRRTHPVGQKEPNGFGIFDMHGNVWEWCSDWYGNYALGESENPAGPPSGDYRVLRGGAWYYLPQVCRSAYRYRDIPSRKDDCYGFRLCCATLPANGVLARIIRALSLEREFMTLFRTISDCNAPPDFEQLGKTINGKIDLLPEGIDRVKWHKRFVDAVLAYRFDFSRMNANQLEYSDYSSWILITDAESGWAKAANPTREAIWDMRLCILEWKKRLLESLHHASETKTAGNTQIASSVSGLTHVRELSQKWFNAYLQDNEIRFEEEMASMDPASRTELQKRLETLLDHPLREQALSDTERLARKITSTLGMIPFSVSGGNDGAAFTRSVNALITALPDRNQRKEAHERFLSALFTNDLPITILSPVGLYQNRMHYFEMMSEARIGWEREGGDSVAMWNARLQKLFWMKRQADLLKERLDRIKMNELNDSEKASLKAPEWVWLPDLLMSICSSEAVAYEEQINKEKTAIPPETYKEITEQLNMFQKHRFPTK